MPTYRGAATVFGSNGDTDLTGAASLELQSYGVDHNFDTIELRSYQNVVNGVVFPDEETMEIELTFQPQSTNTTTGQADAKAATVFPSRGAKVVLSNFDLSWLNTNWYYTGGRLSTSMDAPAQIIMTLRKHASDVTTEITG